MNKLLPTVTVAFLLFISNILIAQPYPEWEQYLPQGQAFIYKSKLVGNILYCCNYGGGLIKYNLETGETIPFTVYNSGIASNEITAIDVDSDGNIWLGHSKFGVSKLTPEGCEIFNSSNSGLHNDTVHTICVDKNSKVWVGTKNGIAVLYENTWTYFNKNNSPLPYNLIYEIKVDDQNKKWIGGRGGLSIYDEVDWKVTSFNSSHLYVTRIAIVNNETAYLTRDHLSSAFCIYHNDTLESLNWPHWVYDLITDIEFDQLGNIWMSISSGMDHFGLIKYDGTSFTEYSIEEPSIPQPSNKCTSLKIDEENNKWLGTLCNGLIKFDNNTFERCEDGLFSCKFADEIAIENDNSIWFSRYEDLVQFNNGEWINSNYYNCGFHLSSIRDIDIGSDGYKWIAGDCELISFNEEHLFAFNETNSPLTEPGYIKDLFVDQNNIVWIAEDGLLKYDGNWFAYNTENSGLPTNYLRCLGMDSSNVLWMGSETEVISFDGQTFHIFDTIATNIYFNSITSICVDSANTKWIGSETGLLTYDNTNWFLYDTINSDLPDNKVTAVQIDKSGKLWVGTENGIGVLNDGDWTVYNSTNSSLFGNHVYDIEVSENNTVWITASGGISKYNKNGFISVEEFPINQTKGVQLHCYPNPFNEFTTIELSPGMDVDGEVVIYNNQGQVIRSFKALNNIQWDGKDNNGLEVKSGIYYGFLKSNRQLNFVKIVKQ